MLEICIHLLREKIFSPFLRPVATYGELQFLFIPRDKLKDVDMLSLKIVTDYRVLCSFITRRSKGIQSMCMLKEILSVIHVACSVGEAEAIQ